MQKSAYKMTLILTIVNIVINALCIFYWLTVKNYSDLVAILGSIYSTLLPYLGLCGILGRNTSLMMAYMIIAYSLLVYCGIYSFYDLATGIWLSSVNRRKSYQIEQANMDKFYTAEELKLKSSVAFAGAVLYLLYAVGMGALTHFYGKLRKQILENRDGHQSHTAEAEAAVSTPVTGTAKTVTEIPPSVSIDTAKSK